MIALNSVLDLSAADPLAHKLNEALSRGGPIDLDGQGVERLSTACIQVLLAASRSAAANDVEFRLTNPSPAIVNAVTDLGLTKLILLGESA